jgi:hypothetical protein
MIEWFVKIPIWWNEDRNETKIAGLQQLHWYDRTFALTDTGNSPWRFLQNLGPNWDLCEKSEKIRHCVIVTQTFIKAFDIQSLIFIFDFAFDIKSLIFIIDFTFDIK